MTICYIFVISICLALCLVANISEDESKIIDMSNQDSVNTEKTNESNTNGAISNEEVDELIKKIIGQDYN